MTQNRAAGGLRGAAVDRGGLLMRWIGVFLLVPFLSQVTQGQVAPPPPNPVPDGVFDAPADPEEFLGMPCRQFPHSGNACSVGFPHYDLPQEHYGVWYRPRAMGLQRPQRCAPDDWNPRGFGNLFARPCASHRMEYMPYLLTSNRSVYGPAYLAIQPDPHCDDKCTEAKQRHKDKGYASNCEECSPKKKRSLLERLRHPFGG